MTGDGSKNQFDYEYTVAWVDTDALGIMHFSNYFRLCERAEQAYFESKDLEGDGIYLPRVHASCDYKNPLRFKDRAVISVRIGEIGKRHLTFEYSIRNKKDNKICAECRIVVVPVDRNMKPTRLSSQMLDRLR